ncbi:hypothetical protein Pla123a_48890 [Posidoniimonas polymericola]|uniref:Polysaccharide biosynthesis protein n=1 Tax=Posidoniimonas polymericola TaxID=2528002 RepID=A0A5C5XSC4_9BACT|nr:hypothetical protein [Posidoniimonas polymericola]TWT65421.1 hypothetical protein Pla123a_48890 [Posidoniimonas polymericola]
MLRSPNNPIEDPDPNSDWDAAEAGLGPVVLGVLSAVGYVLFYSLNIYLARNLTREDFNDYNVGVSTLLLLASIAPLGLEKLSLKIVPVHLHHGERAHLAGFLRFALLTTFAVSVAICLLVDSAVESALMLNHLGSHFAIPMIVACLPILSVFSVLLESVTAAGAPVAAAALYRVALPLLMIAANLLAWRLHGAASGATASLSFLAAWLGVTLMMGWLLRLRLPRRTDQPVPHNGAPRYDARAWLRESTPLLLHGLLMTAIAQSGVIVLELSPNFHTDASVFAVAMQTGAFIVLFSTSANRFYLPRVALMLKQNNRAGLARLTRQRRLLFGTISAVFVAVVFVFARPLLRLHGPGFDQGYWATCVIAVGAAISTTFSLAPIGLQFSGRQQYVISRIALAAVVSIAACVVLANWYGPVGAAAAYAGPLIALHLTLAHKAHALLAEQ